MNIRFLVAYYNLTYLMVVHYKDAGPIHIRGGDRLEKPETFWIATSQATKTPILRLSSIFIFSAPFEILTFILTYMCVCVLLYFINSDSLYQLNCLHFCVYFIAFSRRPHIFCFLPTYIVLDNLDEYNWSLLYMMFLLLSSFSTFFRI